MGKHRSKKQKQKKTTSDSGIDPNDEAATEKPIAIETNEVNADDNIGQLEQLRSSLGLTATMDEFDSQLFGKFQVPVPYVATCLDSDNNNEHDDDNTLLQLAKSTFRKLSSKSDSGGGDKWKPTPIQLQSWPMLQHKSQEELYTEPMSPFNVIAIATTGSGKTLGYTIPMVASCVAEATATPNRGYVHGLVVVPTRELALQVSKTLKVVAKQANKLQLQHQSSISSLSSANKIVALAIYGGTDREEQLDALTQKARLIVAATPLRLIDLLGMENSIDGKMPSSNERRIQKLFEPLQYLVIDEADQMATKSDMSQQVDLIVSFVRHHCMSTQKWCLFSATLPQRAIAKCHKWIRSPRVTIKVDAVTVGSSNHQGDATATDDRDHRKGPLDLSTIPSHITQILHVCANHKKPKKLMTTIEKIRKDEKARGNGRRRGLLIIFFGRIKTLQYVHDLLQKEQIKGVALHSQMKQDKRESQLNLFRSGKCPILLATDVAARGIHVKNVDYVINYDFPGSLEQYVHRCGRAGRSTVSGGKGKDSKPNQTAAAAAATVYSFFHRELAPMAKDMVDLLRSCNAWVDPNLLALAPEAGDIGESKRKRRKRKKEINCDVGPGVNDGNTAIAKKPKKDSVPKTKQKGSTANSNNLPSNKTPKDNNEVNFSEEEDDFPDLAPNRIVLKRASHVSYSDSDDD